MMTFPKAASFNRTRTSGTPADDRLSIGTAVLVWTVLSTLSWAVFAFAAMQFL